MTGPSRCSPFLSLAKGLSPESPIEANSSSAQWHEHTACPMRATWQTMIRWPQRPEHLPEASHENLNGRSWKVFLTQPQFLYPLTSSGILCDLRPRSLLEWQDLMARHRGSLRQDCPATRQASPGAVWWQHWATSALAGFGWPSPLRLPSENPFASSLRLSPACAWVCLASHLDVCTRALSPWSVMTHRIIVSSTSGLGWGDGIGRAWIAGSAANVGFEERWLLQQMEVLELPEPSMQSILNVKSHRGCSRKGWVANGSDLQGKHGTCWPHWPSAGHPCLCMTIFVAKGPQCLDACPGTPLWPVRLCVATSVRKDLRRMREGPGRDASSPAGSSASATLSSSLLFLGRQSRCQPLHQTPQQVLAAVFHLKRETAGTHGSQRTTLNRFWKPRSAEAEPVSTSRVGPICPYTRW